MAPSDGAPKGSRSRARAASSMSRGSGAIISSCAPAYRGYRFRTIGRVRGEGEGEGEGEGVRTRVRVRVRVRARVRASVRSRDLHTRGGVGQAEGVRMERVAAE